MIVVQHLVNPEDCDELESSILATDLEPPHEVTDPKKVPELAANMRAHGWRGPPIITDGYFAVTGTHRLAAIRHLKEEGLDIGATVPVVDLRDLLEAHGHNVNDFTHPSGGLDYITASQLPWAEAWGLDQH